MERRVVRRIVRETLGFESLRPGQAEALIAVLEGRDTLAVLPTGLGKSAIYQAAGVKLPGPTIVVSPLIALQFDQLEGIREREVGPAAVLNSAVSESEREEALEGAQTADLEFIFVTPEQLAKEEVRASLTAAKPSLFVVDEAHCVSEWGHDFRPEYLALGEAIDAVGRPRILALTATASPVVREEVIARLGMRDPVVVIRGLDRPNLHFEVVHCESEEVKRERLRAEVADTPGAGIVYVATRRRAEEIATLLTEVEPAVEAFHAGMGAKARLEIQQRFMAGELRVVVATTAFGMGIDRADVRFVFHADAPGSLDAYYQEAGRAGRDGEPARCVLFFRAEDLGLRRFFAAAGPGSEDLAAVATLVEDGVAEMAELAERADISEARARQALEELRAAGDASAAAHALEARRQFEASRTEMVRRYAETRRCRGRLLLEYFGEPVAADCDHCDNCEHGLTAEDTPGAAVEEPFPVGAAVIHPTFGTGRVLGYEPGRVTLLFGESGYRVLDMERAIELLTLAGDVGEAQTTQLT